MKDTAGFDPAPSKAENYIASDNDNYPFVIYAGLEYENKNRKNRNIGKPKCTQGKVTGFDPANLTTNEEGKADFKLKTNANNPKTVNVEVAGKKAGEHNVLPAVFQEKFLVTMYYTVDQSGFPESVDTVEIDVGSGYDKVTVPYAFAKQARMEGCGKLSASPDPSRPYISELDWTDKVEKHKKAKGVLIKQPLGVKGLELEECSSCAASLSQFPVGSKIRICDPTVKKMFGNDVFIVKDGGQRINHNHLDLYWKADGPAQDPNNPATYPNGLNAKVRIEYLGKEDN